MKTCTKCKASKPLAEFSKLKTSKDGLQSRCKGCNKTYYAANKEKCAARMSAWYKANPEKVAAANSAWIKANPEKVAALKLAWAKANPEKVAAANSAWIKANPEKQAARSHRRRAREASNGVFLVSRNELDRIYSSPCLACGTNDDITLGHIIPIARGGGHRVGNFISQCLTCNQSQGSMLWAEWKYSSRPRAVEVFAA